LHPAHRALELGLFNHVVADEGLAEETEKLSRSCKPKINRAYDNLNL
jgi:enoyl-CoA hydratase/carnithine racemase